MGELKIKKVRYEAILAEQPVCILCGVNPSITIDHIPPKVAFIGRHAPEGFEFGTCAECNNGSTEHDYLTGFFARFANAGKSTATEQEEVAGLFKTMRIRYPEILQEMGSLTRIEKRNISRQTGMRPRAGESYSDLPVVKVPNAFNEAMNVQAAKITKALHFKHCNVVVPPEASIRFRWFTNTNIMKGDSPLIDEVFQMVQGVGPIQRSKADLRDQFDYKYVIAPTNDIAVFLCGFGNAFGFISFLTFNPAILDEMLIRVKNENGFQNEGFVRALWPRP